jgi:D-glycero-D-manno-heptose 1,7-bisphosphate phosphatase
LKLLILDRDGVINYDSDAYIKSVEEWIPLRVDRSHRAVEQGRLDGSGCYQPVRHRSRLLRHRHPGRHARALALAGGEQGGEVGLIVYCPHGPDDGCDCRKPKPGMLKNIAAHYNVSLTNLWFVGDSLGDLEAAKAVDSQPVLVKTGKGVKTLGKTLPVGTLIFDDLAAIAAELIHTCP